MSVIEGWPMSAVLMMLLCTSMFCSGYNVDIESPIIHRGPDRSKFGYQAEFIKQTTGSVKLFVTAPHQEVISRDRSGHYYLSDPLQVSTREHRNTLPVDRIPEVFNVVAGHFGEEKERFGQTLLLVNSSTVLVCGPLWNDIFGWSSEYPFPVGRCQLVPPGNSSLVLPQNRTTYISYIYVDGSWVRGFFKGFAQFGFSAANLQEGNVLVGIPGYNNGRGTFGILHLSNGKIDLMDDVYDIQSIQSYAYLGFAVAGGNFCGGTKVCLAASDRMSNGKVFITEWKTLSGFKIFHLLQSPQDYSSYGFSLCSMDINGDGLSDLLVSAPAYSDHSISPPSYDEGRVYVYLHLQENSSDNITLAGGRRMFASFGSAIGDIGDINRDSIHDVAIGAPQEDEGRGAVYIYLGSSKGPETTFSQRISGRDIDQTLISFGSHISQTTSDISPYKYPDFAVGSPQSDAVVVLRTRLIINATANIITTTSPINTFNNDCPAAVNNANLSIRGCLQLQLCLVFFAEDPRQYYQSLSFDVSFEIDTLVSYGARRVSLLTKGQDYQSETSVRETLSIMAQHRYCKIYDAILRKDQIIRNPVIPVKMEATFTLNLTSLQQPIKPILNNSLPTSTTEFHFLTKCGANEACSPDLVLEGRVLPIPSEGLDLNVVNRTSEVVLELTLTNKQKIATGIHLTVKIQGHIQFQFIEGEQNNLYLRCQSNVLNHASSLVVCNSSSLLLQMMVLSFKLHFDAASISLQDTSPVINFEVKVMPSDPAHNPEMNMDDNVLELNFTKTIRANVDIDGISNPRSLSFIETDVLATVFTLLVTNRGPMFMPSTHVIISLPYMDSEGIELLTSYNITIRHTFGAEVDCPPVSSFEIKLTTTAAALSTQSSSSLTTHPDKAEYKDCNGYRCKSFQCSLPILQPNSNAVITVPLVFSTSIVSSSKTRLVVYEITANIVKPTTPFLYHWIKPQYKTVSILIYSFKSSLSQAVIIWIMIGGVIGGLLVLTFIVIILKKMGFFQRKYKEKLKRLMQDYPTYQNCPRRRNQGIRRQRLAAAQVFAVWFIVGLMAFVIIIIAILRRVRWDSYGERPKRGWRD